MAVEQAELIRQLQIEVTMIDATKVKSDISDLRKAQQHFVTKEDNSRVTEDVKKIRGEIADCGYDVQTTKDITLKLEKRVELNAKETKTSLNPIREKAQDNKEKLSQVQTSLGVLDDRLKAFVKNAQLSGNTAVGEGNVVQEIEDNIVKIQVDLDSYMKSNSSDFRILRNDLLNKATKEESVQLEQRVGERAEDMVVRLQELFPEKDGVNRKINKIDRQLR